MGRTFADFAARRIAFGAAALGVRKSRRISHRVLDVAKSVVRKFGDVDSVGAADRTVNATQIEPDATMEIGADDGKLVDYVIGDIDKLPEPYMAVVHLSNTHFPYKVDPRHSPFLPEAEASGPGYENEIKNRYQDSIYLQDMAVGRLVKSIRARKEKRAHRIVFVSDHGEQMREKGAVGHTGTLWEEEIRIPAWIDAPKDSLTTSERASLASLERTPLTSLDVLPTLLDLLGVWDDPAIADFEKTDAGSSLLRGGSPPETPIAHELQ